MALSLPDEGRVDHDVFDEMVAEWAGAQTAADVPETLRVQGIPAERVIPGDQMYDGDLIGAQLDARGYYEELVHPITGPRRFPGWPFRITPGPPRHHRAAPPTLGRHHDEVLGELGVSADEVASLRAERVIGARPLNA